jgi:hypothetical protein
MYQPLGDAPPTPDDYQPLIFIHIPKTAGTSFRSAAEQFFGRTAVARDYGKGNLATTALVRQTTYLGRTDALYPHMYAQGIRMLTGHFPANRYLHPFGCGARWCTFLRDPVQRVISEYKHVVRHRSYTESLEEFCQSPPQRNKQIRMLEGLEPHAQFFIGITEWYRQSIEAFNRIAGTDLPYLEENMTRSGPAIRHKAPRKTLRLIRESNAEEVAFYQRYAARYTE